MDQYIYTLFIQERNKLVLARNQLLICRNKVAFECGESFVCVWNGDQVS